MRSVGKSGTGPADRNFIKWKDEAMHLGRNNCMHQYMQRAGCLESSFAEKELEVLVEISQQQ